MDFFNFLAESSQPFITESFLKWVVGGMSLAVVALSKYVVKLVTVNKELLEKQLKEGLEMRDKIEDGIRSRYKEVIDAKDKEISDQEKDIKDLHTERLAFLQAQIDDAQKQEKGYQELASDYEELIEELIPILKQNTDVVEYYNSAVRAMNRRKKGGQE